MHYNIKFAVDIARGIKYLHEKQNVIQRDVKCRNILVDRSLNAKISDFGLSRQKSNTAQMTACGTPAWIAPEIVRMEQYTEQADVYSFAIVSPTLLFRGSRSFTDEDQNLTGNVSFGRSCGKYTTKPSPMTGKEAFRSLTLQLRKAFDHRYPRWHQKPGSLS